MLPRMCFVLGGAASGKSAWAENLILSSALDPAYIATARVFDDEIKRKVFVHKNRRTGRWTDFEADLDLGPVLDTLGPEQAVLIDCATMWLSNHMLDGADVDAATDKLLTAVSASAAPVVIVSNEVGQGIVPDNAMARDFRERQGRLNIALAAQADTVVQVVAGLPVVIKGTLP